MKRKWMAVLLSAAMLMGSVAPVYADSSVSAAEDAVTEANEAVTDADEDPALDGTADAEEALTVDDTTGTEDTVDSVDADAEITEETETADTIVTEEAAEETVVEVSDPEDAEVSLAGEEETDDAVDLTEILTESTDSTVRLNTGSYYLTEDVDTADYVFQINSDADVTIDLKGHAITYSGKEAMNSHIFYVYDGAALTLKNGTIRNQNLSYMASVIYGDAYSYNNGDLCLQNLSFEDNTLTYGCLIDYDEESENEGSLPLLTAVNCTFSGNRITDRNYYYLMILTLDAAFTDCTFKETLNK